VNPVWADLLNSDWHDYLGRGRDEDRLENPAWVERFLSRWGPPGAFGPPRRVRTALRRLRTLLARMVSAALAGRDPSPRDWAALGATLAAAPLVRRLERGKGRCAIRLAPAARGLEAVLGDVAAEFAAVFEKGEQGRIRLCENPDCRWVIHDTSHGGNRRWCEGPGGCGNLMKVRRFRERSRASHKSSRARSRS